MELRYRSIKTTNENRREKERKGVKRRKMNSGAFQVSFFPHSFPLKQVRIHEISRSPARLCPPTKALPTDRPTDGPTDQPTEWLIESHARDYKAQERSGYFGVFLVVSHKSIRGCVCPSVSRSVC